MLYHLYIGNGKRRCDHVFTGDKEKCIELAVRWLNIIGQEFDMFEAPDGSIIWDKNSPGADFVFAYTSREFPDNDTTQFDFYVESYSKLVKKSKKR